ncbi:DUF6197 family protein [Aquibium oceanicum]|uniref:Uncharacterized protein n=1 Tax=Aquibium oceanicum TaxID=1670800 RepID=A0A1L3SXK3_9HYPH|nr:hypothetical protein [Aquibium oceanicum]APH74156.1 hypothetical protein BSQ44_24365 [Aquibium oceanicum]
MNTYEILTKARELVAAGWNKGHYGESANGITVGPLHEDAVCFCTMGALFRAAGTFDEDIVHPAVQALGFEYSGQVLLWNDEKDRTQDEVLARFDNAIKELAA